MEMMINISEYGERVIEMYNEGYDLTEAEHIIRDNIRCEQDGPIWDVADSQGVEFNDVLSSAVELVMDYAEDKIY